ncbi:MAG: hypothetical protein DMG34_17790 [Acidobacteria bacterium]|nr:MAG: hypothetical protein DMG34_17790 [Acidobacteriota bacterium]
MNQPEYHHVDVFAARPFSGNSLTVFLAAGALLGSQMLTIRQEMRHFESIFLSSAGTPNTFHAQVFGLTGEPDFVGHPLLGAARSTPADSMARRQVVRCLDTLECRPRERLAGGGLLLRTLGSDQQARLIRNKAPAIQTA